MKFFKYSLSTLVILLVTISIDAKRDYSIELLEITSKFSDAEFFKVVNHSVTDKKVGSFVLLFGKNVTEWSVKLCLDILTKGNRRMNMLKTEIDVCQILQSLSHNNFVSVFLKEILRTSNLPRKCPLVEHVFYSVKNYTVNDDSYPVILPAVFWQFDLNSILNKVYALNITVRGRVRKFK